MRVSSKPFKNLTAFIESSWNDQNWTQKSQNELEYGLFIYFRFLFMSV